MTCSACLDHYGQMHESTKNLKNQNAFLQGSTNLRILTITDHEICSSHITAVNVLKSKTMTPAVKAITTSGKALLSLKVAEQSRLAHLFRNAHAISKQGRPLSDFKWLCNVDKAKGVDIGNSYINEKAALSFVNAIACAERTATIKLLREANCFIIMDGSTDISGDDQESVYIRTAKKGLVQEKFLTIGYPNSTCSQDLFKFIKDVFETYDLPTEKLIGMGSDGASNMVGRISGLATLIRSEFGEDIINVHCLCHRLELAFRDAVRNLKLYDKMMTLLIGLYYFYKKSYKNKKNLKECIKALNLNNATLPPKVTGTRWLPHLHGGISSLLKTFKAYDASLSTLSHSNAKAEGLWKLMCDINMVAYILFMQTLIDPLMKLSKKLQMKDITLGDSLLWIETTAEMVKDIKTGKFQEIDMVNQTKTYQGIQLRGAAPSMIYKDELVNKVVEAFHRRYNLDANVQNSDLSKGVQQRFCPWETGPCLIL